MAREADNTLSVVASTDDESFVEELERLFEGDAKLIVVSTRALRTRRAQAVQVLPFESAYRRNRGLALAAGDVVAFLEEGQLPAREWQAAVLRPFTGDPRPAAVAAGLPLHVGGNVAYDRRRLLGVHGFPLFTGAEPGSPVPDLLALLRLRSDRGGVATDQGMTLVRGGVAPSRDAEVLGRMLRARRQPLLAARRVLRDLRRGAVGDVLVLLNGALRRQDRPYRSPLDVAPVPAPVAELIEPHTLIPLGAPRKAKLHFLYGADDLVVHVYASPTDHLRDAIAAHRAIRERSTANGIPRVVACEEGTDVLWLVEDRMAGEPINGSTLAQSRERVAEWIVALGGPPGPPLASSGRWQAHRSALSSAGFPDAATDRVLRSLHAVQDLPSRHLHGDLNPRNVLVGEGGFAAVDWENAALEFLPGLDLVFLFLLAGGAPDEDVVLRPAPLASHLEKLGIGSRLLPDALRVMLATWALGERNRRSRLGVDPGPPLFEPLFLRTESALS